MTGERTRWLAGGMVLVSGVLLATAVLMASAAPRSMDGLAIGLLVIIFPAMGGVIVAKAPANRIGWTYLGSGILGGLYLCALTTAETWKLLGRDGWNVLGSASNIPYFPWIFSMLVIPLLLFPNGELPSRRWRWASWVAGLFILLWLSMAVVSPGYGPELADTTVVPESRVSLEGGTVTFSPGGVESDEPGEVLTTTDFSTTPGGDLLFTIEDTGRFITEADGSLFTESDALVNPLQLVDIEAVLPVLDAVGQILLLSSMAGALAALVVRFWRSKGIERLQMKWLAYTAALAAIGLMATYALDEYSTTWWLDIVTSLGLLGALLIPVATGIAIVRYRLYDIDRLISRTVVYGLLVVLVAGVYVGGVFLTSQVLPGDDTFSIAISTLAAAAAFNPLRRRLQDIIDRRLYRSRYDAEALASEFSSRLQHEVDIDTLSEELVSVVDDTVKPESVGLWVRGQD